MKESVILPQLPRFKTRRTNPIVTSPVPPLGSKRKGSQVYGSLHFDPLITSISSCQQLLDGVSFIRLG